MLYDKEFDTESEARNYMDLIMAEDGYYADYLFDRDHGKWVVEVWSSK